MKLFLKNLMLISAIPWVLAACGTPTAVPTEVPTAVSETAVPTEAPTSEPTVAPTVVPTEESATVSNTETNRAAAIDAFTRMFQGDATAVDQYFAEDFVNHNPYGGGQGLDSYRQISTQLGAAGFPMWEAIRSIASGDYVAVQGLYHFESLATFKPDPDAPGVVAIDLFRFENGKIVEHWDALQDVVPAEKTPDNNDMLSGAIGKPGEPAIDPKVAQDAVVALSNGDKSLIKTVFSEAYVNHNPFGADGWSGLEQLADILGSAGFQMYTPLRAFADGDLVILHGIYHFENIESFKPSQDAPGVIAFDIFRIEDGKIVEHWDVLQNNVPSEKTSSGISTTGDGLSK
ncbi:MAG TPA: nuclear transport factor 2 family protein [Anaerolineales bacterium]|nr:nuclear transport factor 2 family protein [Anaerolineales bacterium]